MVKMLKGLVIAASATFAIKAPATERVELNDSNLVVLRGEVSSASVAKVSHQILSNPNKEVVLYINSPGGSILAGAQLIYAMKSSGKSITCITSVGASMAFAITQACNKRLVMPHSILMQHVASYGLDGQDPNNRSMVKFLVDMIDELQEWQAKRIGISKKDFVAITRDDWWLYGQKAINANAADEMVEVTCSQSLSQRTIDETIRVFVFNVKVKWSGCPLVEAPLSVELDNKEAVQDRKTRQEIERVIDSLDARQYIESQHYNSNQ